MQLAVDAAGVLIEVRLPNRVPAQRPQDACVTSAAEDGLREAERQLGEYFRGERRTFDLQFHAHGTPFEQQVWQRLCDIPYGATISYGRIAAELELINGARAVGRANGANPIPIVIPCHRVIGADGSLVGFGGGMPLKRALLEFEGALPRPALTLF